MPQSISRRLRDSYNKFKNEWPTSTSIVQDLNDNDASSAETPADVSLAVRWLHSVLVQTVPLWTQNNHFLEEIKPVVCILRLFLLYPICLL